MRSTAEKKFAKGTAGLVTSGFCFGSNSGSLARVTPPPCSLTVSIFRAVLISWVCNPQ